MTESPDKTTKALLSIRIIWAMMLAGQLVFLIVVVTLLGTGFVEGPTDLHPVAGYIGLGVLVVAAPAAHIARQQVYKANWQGEAISPGGYANGNIVHLAILEGAAIVNLIAALISGSWVPGLISALVAMAIQAASYPNGRAMQPSAAQP